MILLVILIFYLVLKIKKLKKNDLKFLLLGLIIISVTCIVQAYLLAIKNNSIVVGSDAFWYYSNARDFSIYLADGGNFFSFFEFRNIDTKYYLYTIFNLFSLIKSDNMFLQSLILQLNYGLIIIIFAIELLKYRTIYKLKISNLCIGFILGNLCWMMIANFRDGFISMILILIILSYYYDKKTKFKYIKNFLLLSVLYFLRYEFVFLLFVVWVIEKIITKFNISIYIKNIFLIGFIFLGILGVTLILTNSLNILPTLKGIAISLVVNNPIKFFIRLFSETDINGAWVFTDVSEVLSILLCISILFIAIPKIIIGFADKYNSIEKRMWITNFLLFVLVLTIYSAEFGATQDRIKIVPVNMMIICSYSLQEHIDKWKVISGISYIFMIIHTMRMMFI